MTTFFFKMPSKNSPKRKINSDKDFTIRTQDDEIFEEKREIFSNSFENIAGPSASHDVEITEQKDLTPGTNEKLSNIKIDDGVIATEEKLKIDIFAKVAKNHKNRTAEKNVDEIIYDALKEDLQKKISYLKVSTKSCLISDLQLEVTSHSREIVVKSEKAKYKTTIAFLEECYNSYMNLQTCSSYDFKKKKNNPKTESRLIRFHNYVIHHTLKSNIYYYFAGEEVEKYLSQENSKNFSDLANETGISERTLRNYSLFYRIFYKYKKFLYTTIGKERLISNYNAVAFFFSFCVKSEFKLDGEDILLEYLKPKFWKISLQEWNNESNNY
jgi:hypothetical protein